jgi:hypothetical protein
VSTSITWDYVVGPYFLLDKPAHEPAVFSVPHVGSVGSSPIAHARSRVTERVEGLHDGISKSHVEIGGFEMMDPFSVLLGHLTTACWISFRLYVN